MSIIIHCNACDKRFKVPDRFAGKRAKCKCGAAIRIPALQQHAEIADLSSVVLLSPNPENDKMVQPVDTTPLTTEPEDTQSQCLDEDVATSREREAMKECLSAAIRLMTVMLPLSLIVLLVATYVMRSPIIAAAESLTQKTGGVGTHTVFMACMPVTLFALFGLLTGGFTGWRMVDSSGVAGMPGWLVGAVAMLVLLVVGGTAGVFVFQDAVPFMFWACLATFNLIYLVAITYFTIWTA